MSDNVSIKLWPTYEVVTGNMLFAPVFPRAPIPVYVSAAQLAGFIGSEASAVATISPASGNTVTLTGDTYVASGALAALTVRLPGIIPWPGYPVAVCFAAPVALLTVQDSRGVAVAGAPTSAFGPGAALVFRHVEGPGWLYWK
jgi:hypothetical protein